MSAAVKLDRVVKRYGALEVLKGVSFDIQPGEVVALIGASGSGKSTALRCINRLEQIQEGRIEVCGRCGRMSGWCSSNTTCSRT